MTGVIVYCQCANASTIPEETTRQVLAELHRSQRPVVAFDDLCGRAAEGDSRLSDIAAADESTIIACYPRAVLWLFHRAGFPLDAGRVRLLNMRTQPVEEILDAIRAESVGPAEQDRTPMETAADSWRPWFPVIDYDRCTQCRQCLEFCLFGVYDADEEGRVRVRHPQHCKDNCPACARMCPQVAIMFPKIDEDSPISGSDADAASAHGRVRLTQEQLFGGNAVERLRARQNRSSLLKKRIFQDSDDTAADQTNDG